jgi:PAS domain-containing protein
VSGTLAPFVLAAQAGRTVTREGWVNYRRGGPKYITWVFTPKRADDGSVEGVLLFMRDTTELKRHEEELARRTAQLEAILASIAEGVNVVDGAGRLVLCNRGFLDLFGFPRRSAVPARRSRRWCASGSREGCTTPTRRATARSGRWWPRASRASS